MRYEDVIERIFNMRRFGGMKLGLERVEELAKRLGNPQDKYKIIHVGGSNGKGSTVALIASILRAAGYKVGSFTSPHLSRFTERTVVNGEEIPEEKVVELFEEIEKVSAGMSEKPTFFEVTTAMALKWFEEQKVDFAVIEVGLGGRLDATNIVNPLVSVITNVALEHTDVLGDSIIGIAREKGGIIKKDGVLITAVLNDEAFELYKEMCKEKGSRAFRVGEDIKFVPKAATLDYQEFDLKGLEKDYEGLKIPLLGEHQLRNAAAALGAVEALSFYEIDIDEKAIREGLASVKWPGRLEIVQRNPMVVLDCAKDPLAMESLSKALKDLFDFEKLIVVVSISKDKKLKAMLDTLIPITNHVIAARHTVQERAVDPRVIAEKFSKKSKETEIIEDVKAATKRAIEIAGEKDLVCVTGSIFTVGEARELWFGQNNSRFGRELNEP